MEQKERNAVSRLSRLKYRRQLPCTRATEVQRTDDRKRRRLRMFTIPSHFHPLHNNFALAIGLSGVIAGYSLPDIIFAAPSLMKEIKIYRGL